MSYDIYGEILRKGHCEVHPHVHEEYPCSFCMAERELNERQETGPYPSIIDLLEINSDEFIKISLDIYKELLLNELSDIKQRELFEKLIDVIGIGFIEHIIKEKGEIKWMKN